VVSTVTLFRVTSSDPLITGLPQKQQWPAWTDARKSTLATCSARLLNRSVEYTRLRWLGGFRDCLREPILVIGFFQQARSQTGGRHAGSQFAQASGLFSIDLQELRVTDASMSKGHAEPVSKKSGPLLGAKG